MDQLGIGIGQSEHSPTHITHEYPDPDFAAYITKYPWREDDGYVPPALHGLPPASLGGFSPRIKYSSPGKDIDYQGEIFDSDAQGPARELTWDPDYQVSDPGVT